MTEHELGVRTIFTHVVHEDRIIGKDEDANARYSIAHNVNMS